MITKRLKSAGAILMGAATLGVVSLDCAPRGSLDKPWLSRDAIGALREIETECLHMVPEVPAEAKVALNTEALEACRRAWVRAAFEEAPSTHRLLDPTTTCAVLFDYSQDYKGVPEDIVVADHHDGVLKVVKVVKTNNRDELERRVREEKHRADASELLWKYRMTWDLWGDINILSGYDRDHHPRLSPACVIEAQKSADSVLEALRRTDDAGETRQKLVQSWLERDQVKTDLVPITCCNEPERATRILCTNKGWFENNKGHLIEAFGSDWRHYELTANERETCASKCREKGDQCNAERAKQERQNVEERKREEQRLAAEKAANDAANARAAQAARDAREKERAECVAKCVALKKSASDCKRICEQ